MNPKCGSTDWPSVVTRLKCMLVSHIAVSLSVFEGARSQNSVYIPCGLYSSQKPSPSWLPRLHYHNSKIPYVWRLLVMQCPFQSLPFREAKFRSVGGLLRSHRVSYVLETYRPEDDIKIDLGGIYDEYVDSMDLMNYVFLDIAPRSPLNVIRRFGETFRFNLKGWISQERNQREISRKQNVVSQKIELIITTVRTLGPTDMELTQAVV